MKQKELETRLLPIEPTQEMKTAALDVVLIDVDTGAEWELCWEEATAIYKAMINAYQEKK